MLLLFVLLSCSCVSCIWLIYLLICILCCFIMRVCVILCGCFLQWYSPLLNWISCVCSCCFALVSRGCILPLVFRICRQQVSEHLVLVFRICLQQAFLNILSLAYYSLFLDCCGVEAAWSAALDMFSLSSTFGCLSFSLPFTESPVVQKILAFRSLLAQVFEPHGEDNRRGQRTEHLTRLVTPLGSADLVHNRPRDASKAESEAKLETKQRNRQHETNQTNKQTIPTLLEYYLSIMCE